MDSFIFKLPDLGEGTVESEIVEWRVQPGDSVEAEQPLVDMMTDKATVEITSPVSGRVVKLAGKPGDMIAVGAELVVFETGRDAPVNTADTGSEAALPAVAPSSAAAITPVDTVPPATDLGLKPLASPAVRRRAREAGVDLRSIPGSGPDGRIRKSDLEQLLLHASAPARGAHPERRTATRQIPVIGLRRKIAEKMAVAKRHIPHFTYVEEIDVTELESLRLHLNEQRKEGQPKLSYLPFLMRALARVLVDFPQCNAHYDDGQNVITQYAGIHAGIATQTDNGLMVPVVKHVEALDLWGCATEVQRVADAARSGKARKEDLTGSTITLTSLGALGGIVSTPVINHPEVAIIGVNKVQERPVFQGGVVVPRLCMNLSSSFDHRVVDGYDAARMIQAMKDLLEHPARIFMAD